MATMDDLAMQARRFLVLSSLVLLGFKSDSGGCSDYLYDVRCAHDGAPADSESTSATMTTGESSSTGLPTTTAEEPYCGDGFVDNGEKCDEGAKNTQGPHTPTRKCLNDCSNYTQYCGDGIENGPEVCDDGDDNSDAYSETKHCNLDCTKDAPHCGDGICQTGDENPNTCSDCKAVMCGNKKLEPGEVCDDGTTDNSGACVDGCTKVATCGDNYVQTGVEECDDGNDDDTDACVKNCKTATCGDGFVQVGVEDCDDKNVENGDGCSSICEAPRLVFVSSTSYLGSLGGLDGADTKCQTLANAASLKGKFRAWLSDDKGSPSIRFDTSFQDEYQLVTGEVVATGWLDLIDGSLAHAIDRDEKGAQVTGETVWTNTDVSGEAVKDGKHCTQWSLAVVDVENKPFIGNQTETTGAWTKFDDSLCNVPLRLYCFENP